MWLIIGVGLAIIIVFFGIYGLVSYLAFEKLDVEDWQNNHDLY